MEEDESSSSQKDLEYDQKPQTQTGATSLLRRGLRLGKNLAIASAAITTAPVFIPPLMVGLAFAFPFGLYFAGFACTDKAMRALLSPQPQPSSVLVDDNEMKQVIDGGDILHSDHDEQGMCRLVEGEAAKTEMVSDEEEQAKMKGDEPVTMTKELAGNKLDYYDEPATGEILMWPPTCNLDISSEERDNMEVMGTGAEEFGDDMLENTDEPADVSAAHEIEMWPPTCNLDISRGEGFNMEVMGTGEEWHAEEFRDDMLENTDEPAGVSAAHVIEMWPPTFNLDISREELGGGMLENTDEPAGVSVPHEIEICPPISNQNLSSKEGENMEDMGTGGERHEEELRGGELDNSNEPAIVAAGHESEMRPSVDLDISKEEGDIMEIMGTGGERQVEELKGIKLDSYDEPSTVTTLPEIEIRPPSTLDISSESGDKMEVMGTEERNAEELGGTKLEDYDEHDTVIEPHEVEIPPPTIDQDISGKEGERHVEELRGRGLENHDKPATDAHEIEIWPPAVETGISSDEGENMEETKTDEERHVEELRGRELENCETLQKTKIKDTSPVEAKGDKIQDIRMMAEENEERGLTEEKENGVSGYSSTVNSHMQAETVYAEGEDKPLEVMHKVDKEKAEEEMREILDLGTAVPEMKEYQKDYYPCTEMTTEERNNEIRQTIFSSEPSATIEKGNRTIINETKYPEMVIEGCRDQINDKLNDAPLSVPEAKEQIPPVHYSLAAVPEEHEVGFQLPKLSSSQGFPATSNIDGCSSKKTVEEGNKMKEENEQKGHEDIEQTQNSYIVATVVSVECKSVVKQNKDEGKVETCELAVVSERSDGGVLEAEYCSSSAAASHTREPPVSLYQSFASLAPLECMSDKEPASLSTEYASAVEDQSSDLTDAESRVATTSVEIAQEMHHGDKVSLPSPCLLSTYCIVI